MVEFQTTTFRQRVNRCRAEFPFVWRKIPEYVESISNISEELYLHLGYSSQIIVTYADYSTSKLSYFNYTPPKHPKHLLTYKAKLKLLEEKYKNKKVKYMDYLKEKQKLEVAIYNSKKNNFL